MRVQQERWWTRVAVERVAEFSYLLFFPDEISEFNKEEIVVLSRTGRMEDWKEHESTLCNRCWRK